MSPQGAPGVPLPSHLLFIVLIGFMDHPMIQKSLLLTRSGTQRQACRNTDTHGHTHTRRDTRDMTRSQKYKQTNTHAGREKNTETQEDKHRNTHTHTHKQTHSLYKLSPSILGSCDVHDPSKPWSVNRTVSMTTSILPPQPHLSLTGLGRITCACLYIGNEYWYMWVCVRVCVCINHNNLLILDMKFNCNNKSECEVRYDTELLIMMMNAI